MVKTYDELIVGIGDIKNRYCIVLFILINFALIQPEIYGILFILLPTNFRCNWTETLIQENLTTYLDVLPPVNASVFDNQCKLTLKVVNQTVKCQTFVYESTTSMISEFNLVCDREYWVNMIKGIFWLGYLAATPVGMLADRFGRKTLIIAISCVGIASYLGCCFSNGPLMYLIFHFFKGFNLSTAYLFIILQLELLNVDGRRYISASWIGFTLWGILLVPIAYMLPYWRHIQYISAGVTSVLLVISLLYPESPRWLLVMNKRKKAQEALDWFAAKNNCPKVDLRDAKVEKESTATCKEVFSHKSIIVRVVFAVFLWFSMNIIYYGISLNVNFASTNPYISQLAMNLTEIPVIPFSIFICWLTTYKRSMYSLGIITVVAIFTGYFVADYYIARIIISSIGKFSAAVLFLVIITFTEELYPTEFRTTGHNFTNLSRISNVIVPYIIDLKKFHPIIPVLIICTTGILMIISIIPFPESKGWPLSQNVNDLRPIRWSNFNQPAKKSENNEIEETVSSNADRPDKADETEAALIT